MPNANEPHNEKLEIIAILIGAIKKINKRDIALVQMENIKLFLNFAWRLGLPSSTLFTSSDLYQRRGLTEVLRCLEALARHTTTMSSWNGPKWTGGPKGRKRSDADNSGMRKHW